MMGAANSLDLFFGGRGNLGSTSTGVDSNRQARTTRSKLPQSQYIDRNSGVTIIGEIATELIHIGMMFSAKTSPSTNSSNRSSTTHAQRDLQIRRVRRPWQLVRS